MLYKLVSIIDGPLGRWLVSGKGRGIDVALAEGARHIKADWVIGASIHINPFEKYEQGRWIPKDTSGAQTLISAGFMVPYYVQDVSFGDRRLMVVHHGRLDWIVDGVPPSIRTLNAPGFNCESYFGSNPSHVLGVGVDLAAFFKAFMTIPINDSSNKRLTSRGTVSLLIGKDENGDSYVWYSLSGGRNTIVNELNFIGPLNEWAEINNVVLHHPPAKAIDLDADQQRLLQSAPIFHVLPQDENRAFCLAKLLLNFNDDGMFLDILPIEIQEMNAELAFFKGLKKTQNPVSIINFYNRMKKEYSGLIERFEKGLESTSTKTIADVIGCCAEDSLLRMMLVDPDVMRMNDLLMVSFPMKKTFKFVKRRLGLSPMSPTSPVDNYLAVEPMCNVCRAHQPDNIVRMGHS